MENIEKLVKFVRDLNKEIETEIEDISTMVNIVLETDGEGATIRFGTLEMWTDKEEEINCLDDLRRILLDRISQEITQIDGMFRIWSGINNGVQIT